jgi:hypothetical protein
MSESVLRAGHEKKLTGSPLNFGPLLTRARCTCATYVPLPALLCAHLAGERCLNPMD